MVFHCRTARFREWRYPWESRPDVDRERTDASRRAKAVEMCSPGGEVFDMNNWPASKKGLARRGGRSGRKRDGDDTTCFSASLCFAGYAHTTLPGVLVEHLLEIVCEVFTCFDSLQRSSSPMWKVEVVETNGSGRAFVLTCAKGA